MESPARAADRARLQALFLCRGCGPAVVAGSVQAPHAGTCGDGGQRRARHAGIAARRGGVPVGPGDAAERLAVAGHGFVSVSGTGYQVREEARESSP
jgi:hypothetical protein